LVTEITLKLSPRYEHRATLLAPFSDHHAVSAVVPPLLRSGVAPAICEYLDLLTMAGVCRAADLTLGIPEDMAAAALAYLVVVLETRTAEQLEVDIAHVGSLLSDAGALDVFVLADGVAHQLIEARERAFWSAKAAGAHDVLDIVVPRAAVPDFLDHARTLAEEYGVFLSGCGHVGDGNVHMSVFQPDDDQRHAFLTALFTDGVRRGGAISGEHGLGRDKRDIYLATTDPTVVALQRQIKAVFDPEGRLNPYRHLDTRAE
jgi:glycolate oxidase